MIVLIWIKTVCVEGVIYFVLRVKISIYRVNEMVITVLDNFGLKHLKITF